MNRTAATIEQLQQLKMPIKDTPLPSLGPTAKTEEVFIRMPPTADGPAFVRRDNGLSDLNAHFSFGRFGTFKNKPHATLPSAPRPSVPELPVVATVPSHAQTIQG